MELVYYNADRVLAAEHLPGMREFAGYFLIYGRAVAPVDRTNTIKLPIKTKSLFPLPPMRPFPYHYEEVCQERAQGLLIRAEKKLKCPIFLCWSGGVDSTCMLVAFLKISDFAERQRITVLLSEESISEYPDFYRKYIRGQLRCASAMQLPYLLGRENLIVNGEGNDQLFGSDIIADAVGKMGFETVTQPFDREALANFLTMRMRGDVEAAQFYVAMFEKLGHNAPIDLKTNFDVFWWVNFALKWQTVYCRMLAFTAKQNEKLITKSYLKNYYAPFYMTNPFQLWSMNADTEGRIKNGWRSYKWQAKELIYNFTKDEKYRDNKLKRGSLQYLVKNQPRTAFIDANLRFHNRFEVAKHYREDNDFIRPGAST